MTLVLVYPDWNEPFWEYRIAYASEDGGYSLGTRVRQHSMFGNAKTFSSDNEMSGSPEGGGNIFLVLQGTTLRTWFGTLGVLTWPSKTSDATT